MNVSRVTRLTTVAAWACALSVLVPPLVAQNYELADFLMERDSELALARTGGPEAITGGATYYVLTKTGYQRVLEGDNGFHCFVERSWGAPVARDPYPFDPRVRAPHCINSVGAASTMEEIFMVAELAMQGLPQATIQDRIDEAYESGALRLPDGLSLTYMMSAHQWLGENVGAWRPHLMLWIPHLTREEVGANPFGGPNAVVAGAAGSRRSVLIVPLVEWIGE